MPVVDRKPEPKKGTRFTRQVLGKGIIFGFALIGILEFINHMGINHTLGAVIGGAVLGIATIMATD